MTKLVRAAWTAVALLGVTAVNLGTPALAEEPIKIGVILPYSGVYASLGGEITQGLELGFETYGPEVAGRAGVPVAGLARGDVLRLGDWRLRVLRPRPGAVARGSAVIRLMSPCSAAQTWPSSPSSDIAG